MSPVERGQTQPEPVETRSVSSESRVRSYSALQLQLLLRLERLLRLRRQQQALPTREEWVLRALDKAIYSTLCDCMDLGVGEDGRVLLRGDTPAPGAQSGE